jgi:ArsR family transcriptional regulator, cadmium/lead-responsive transcriptional repressor
MTCKESTRQHAVDGPRLSCEQQVGGSSPPASSKRGWSEAPLRRALIQAGLYYLAMSTMLASDVDVLQRIGTALADPTRRRILTMLLAGPAYPAELADVLDVSRAKVSNHLACLRGCGLVTTTRQGRQVRYQLADDRLAGALRELARVVLDSPACPAHLGPRP